MIPFPIVSFDALLRRRGAAAVADADQSLRGTSPAGTPETSKESEGRVMGTTPGDILARAEVDGNVIDYAQYVYEKARAFSERYQKQEDAREVARRLHRGDYHITDNLVASNANPMGVDPSQLPACALRCGEKWYSGGRVVHWWTHYGSMQYAHYACWKFAATLGVPPTGGAA